MEEKESLTYKEEIYQRLLGKPMLIVDLYSGRHKPQFEKYNLTPNPNNGRFYGYCPWNDKIDITRLGAHKADKSIAGVTVVYVQKAGPHTYDREVIAFCLDATVHRYGITNPSLGRVVTENGRRMDCSYTIESDSLVDIRTTTIKRHTITPTKNIFRGQRIYEKMHPQIFKDVSSYLVSVLEYLETVGERSHQEAVQNTDPKKVPQTSGDPNVKPDIVTVHGSPAVKRNSGVAKRVIYESSYKCAANPNHITFVNSRQEPYMEAHHLIPCTAANANKFWEDGNHNIDCDANIVCLCPTCHRHIHYGADEDSNGHDGRKKLIKTLYDQKKGDLAKVGLNITLYELYELYNIH